MRTLAVETPAVYVLFDLLVDDRSALFERTLESRREQLESLRRAQLHTERQRAALSGDVRRRARAAVARRQPGAARRRHRQARRALRVRQPRRRGQDQAQLHGGLRVGGFRASSDGTIASLLLGLYDDEESCITSASSARWRASERRRAGELLRPIVEPPGFTGTAPGGPSRWRREQGVGVVSRAAARSLWRSPSITSPRGVSATPRAYCDGVRTSRRVSARWSSCSVRGSRRRSVRYRSLRSE